MFEQIEVITLFVDDLAGSKEFYRSVFRADVVYEDEDSCVLGFANLMVNLLQAANAPELVQPAQVAPEEAGSRFMFTIVEPNAKHGPRDHEALWRTRRPHWTRQGASGPKNSMPATSSHALNRTVPG